MGNYQRKFTFEKSREKAARILELYEEHGATPKELGEWFDLSKQAVWQKIKQARKWRDKNSTSQLSPGILPTE